MFGLAQLLLDGLADLWMPQGLLKHRIELAVGWRLAGRIGVTGLRLTCVG